MPPILGADVRRSRSWPSCSIVIPGGGQTDATKDRWLYERRFGRAGPGVGVGWDVGLGVFEQLPCWVSRRRCPSLPCPVLFPPASPAPARRKPSPAAFFIAPRLSLGAVDPYSRSFVAARPLPVAGASSAVLGRGPLCSGHSTPASCAGGLDRPVQRGARHVVFVERVVDATEGAEGLLHRGRGAPGDGAGMACTLCDRSWRLEALCSYGLLDVDANVTTASCAKLKFPPRASSLPATRRRAHGNGNAFADSQAILGW